KWRRSRHARTGSTTQRQRRSVRSPEGDVADGVRLQKFLSQAGVASRRAAEQLMVDGRVRVNGESATELGMRVDPERDVVEVDGRRVRPARPVWIALHKPRGYVTTRSDPEGRPTVYTLLP